MGKISSVFTGLKITLTLENICHKTEYAFMKNGMIFHCKAPRDISRVKGRVMKIVLKTNRRTMGKDWTADSSGIAKSGWTRQTLEGDPRSDGWDLLGFTDGSCLAGLAGGISAIPDVPSTIPRLGAIRSAQAHLEGFG